MVGVRRRGALPLLRETRRYGCPREGFLLGQTPALFSHSRQCPYDDAEPVFALSSRDRHESNSGRKGNTLVECPLQRFFEALPAAASVQVGNVSATGSIREFVRRTQGEACKDFLKGGTARLEMFVKKSAPPPRPRCRRTPAGTGAGCRRRPQVSVSGAQL